MLKVDLLAVLVVGALGAAIWTLDHARGVNALQAEVITGLQAEAARTAAIIEQQAEALARQQETAKALGKIGADMAQLSSLLDQQGDTLAAGLEELKRNDPDAREYLRSPVPAAVGMRHARPETTDIGAYRASAGGVPRADAVPAAGQSRPANQ